MIACLVNICIPIILCKQGVYLKTAGSWHVWVSTLVLLAFKLFSYCLRDFPGRINLVSHTLKGGNVILFTYWVSFSSRALINGVLERREVDISQKNPKYRNWHI